MQTVGENCIVNMANRLTDEECKYGSKKPRKLRGGGCIFNNEWARTFPGIWASNQSAEKAYCVACNTHFGIGHGGRHDVKRHIGRAAHIHRTGSVTFGQHQYVCRCWLRNRQGDVCRDRVRDIHCQAQPAIGDEFGLLAKKMWCTTYQLRSLMLGKY